MTSTLLLSQFACLSLLPLLHAGDFTPQWWFRAESKAVGTRVPRIPFQNTAGTELVRHWNTTQGHPYAIIFFCLILSCRHSPALQPPSTGGSASRGWVGFSPSLHWHQWPTQHHFGSHPGQFSSLAAQGFGLPAPPKVRKNWLCLFSLPWSENSFCNFWLIIL